MRCPNCGQDVPVFAAKCPACGQTAVTDPADPVAGELPGARPLAGPAPASEPAAGGAPAAAAVGGYPSPEQYLAANPAGPPAPSDVSGEAPVPPKRRRLVPILIGALAVLLIGGGVAFAGGMLGWYGGGKGPSDVLPGSTFAYAEFDFDPSLAQKASAWQFLRDLPEVENALAAGVPDPKRLIWDATVKSDPDFKALDYDTEVKPWLGNRLGMAVVEHAGKPAGVLAVETTDGELGAKKLLEFAARTDSDYQVTLRDGYALVTESAQTAFVLEELAKGTLAANPTFAGDFAALGEPGISAGWADLATLARLSAAEVWAGAAGVSQGRVAYTVRFGPDSVEVAGITRGYAGPQATLDGDLGSLPADTAVAISLGGGGAALERSWPEVPKEARDALTSSGLKLADLVALLGNSLQVGASTATIQNLDGTPENLEVGLRVNSDDPERAERALLGILTQAMPDATDLTRVDGSVLVAGTTTAYRDRIAGGGPRLAGSEWFAKAVPDHASSTFAAWVDLEAIASLAPSEAGEYQEFLASLRGWGFQFVPAGTAEGSWSVRVVRA